MKLVKLSGYTENFLICPKCNSAYLLNDKEFYDLSAPSFATNYREVKCCNVVDGKVCREFMKPEMKTVSTV